MVVYPPPYSASNGLLTLKSKTIGMRQLGNAIKGRNLESILKGPETIGTLSFPEKILIGGEKRILVTRYSRSARLVLIELKLSTSLAGL
ncbi:hypothetical protein Tco_1351577 [Tanacetum coccineum]